jgi:hypothetical protein
MDAVADAIRGRALRPGSEVLEEVAAFYGRYVVFPSPAAQDVLALWTAHTYLIDDADTTLYISVTSPEKESGKSRVLETAGLLVANPWYVESLTEAVLFRKIHADHPTVLLDETDRLWSNRERADAVVAVLNGGYRRGIAVPRMVGPGTAMRVQEFDVFGPKMFAGIDKLPDTLASRSVPIRLDRRLPDQPIQDLRLREATVAAEPVVGALQAWIASIDRGELRAARPEVPAELSDRQADAWEPLIAIADAAGDEWPRRARAAAVELHSGQRLDVQASVGEATLRAVRKVFDETGQETLFTKEILPALIEDEEAPFASWWDPRGLEDGRAKRYARDLAKHLRSYEIKPDKVYRDGEKDRGYKREWFEDAWRRYVPTDVPSRVGEVPSLVPSPVPSEKPPSTRQVPLVPFPEGGEPGADGVARARALAAEGKAPVQIAALLSTDGTRPPTGYSRWTVGAVHSVLS